MCKHLHTVASHTGLRNGGGIGDILRLRSKKEPLFAARVVYDMMFYFLVIIIVLNLIFGVIIDTFADLRAEKNEKEVCGGTLSLSLCVSMEMISKTY